MRKTPGGLANLNARGWPGRTLAGEEGAGAAWLLAQHADRDPDRQRAFLHALRGAVDQGEASPAHLAYLEDRVRVNAGQPQLYGTQFTVADREFGPCPIEDRQRLDKRRAEAGLEPFADCDARMRARDTGTNSARQNPFISPRPVALICHESYSLPGNCLQYTASSESNTITASGLPPPAVQIAAQPLNLAALTGEHLPGAY